MNDIDLSGFDWNPIGEVDSNGIKQGFTGVLDGNGYTISNLTINNVAYSGLFAAIGDGAGVRGVVKNLGLEDVNITGGIAGLASVAVGGDIANCYVDGDISGEGMLGGLIGFAGSCNIEYCYASGTVNSGSFSYATGGLIGEIDESASSSLISIKGNTVISNCFTTNTVKNGIYVGGLVGLINGQSQNSVVVECAYSSGSVIGTYAGGLMGAFFDGIVSNSYSTADVTTVPSSMVSDEAAGGLFGSIGGDSSVTKTYSAGNITNTADYSGAFAGTMDGSVSISDSIWNTATTGQNVTIGYGGGTESNNKGLTTAEMQNPANWQGWDTNIWDFSTYPPTFKMYTPVGGGSTGGGTGDTDPDAPGGGGAGDVPIPGAVRLQIGSDSSSTSAIYVDTSFDLGAFDVDFSSADSCAAAIEDIDEVLSRINTKRSEFGAVINRLSSVLESQTTTIQNFTSAKSTIMDADIANESADFVKNQILQQTSSALLAQSQNLHASIVLSLIG